MLFYFQAMEEYEGLLLWPEHPVVQQVKRVGNRILQANNSIPQLYNKSWRVSVIDSPTVNCYVLPVGYSQCRVLQIWFVLLVSLHNVQLEKNAVR